MRILISKCNLIVDFNTKRKKTRTIDAQKFRSKMDNIKDRARLRRRKVKGNAAHTHRPIIRYSSFREEARNDDLPHGFSSVRHTQRALYAVHALVSTMRASRVHAPRHFASKTRVFFLKIYMYIRSKTGVGQMPYNDIFSAVRAFVGAYTRTQTASA